MLSSISWNEPCSGDRAGENWRWITDAVGRLLWDSIGDLGKGVVVFDEVAIGKRLRLAESESNEPQPNPVVQFPDNASVAESEIL
jgi:hypothetical protein